MKTENSLHNSFSLFNYVEAIYFPEVNCLYKNIQNFVKYFWLSVSTAMTMQILEALQIVLNHMHL